MTEQRQSKSKKNTQSAADAVAGKGGSSTRNASGTGAAPDLADQAHDVVDQVQDQAVHLVDQVRQAATTQLSSQKETAASGLETAAGLLRGAGEQLRALDQRSIAQYVDGAAGQVQELSETLRQQDIGQLGETLTRYARRQPASFIGGAIALGFLGTRFFKSSGSTPDQDKASGYPSLGSGANRSYGTDTYEPASRTTGLEGGYGYGTTPETDYTSGLTDPLFGATVGDVPRTGADYPVGSEDR